MIGIADPLPDDLETAHQLIRELLETLGQQIHLNEKLQHQLEQLLRQRYGKKGERIDPAQLLLFAQEILAQAEAAPTSAATSGPEPKSTPIPSASQKNGHGRKLLPASLPRKPILRDVPPEQRICPDCGVERTCIGREVREQLEYVPASIIVLEHIRPKYACRACEGNVVIADRLPEPIEKGLPGPGLMAHVVVSKYADHQPLYRLEGIFKRLGVDLSRSTMCDWMAVSAELLAPVVKLMMSRILTSKVVQNDDTTVPVQDHAGKGIKTGRLWASVGDHYNPYVVYCYTPVSSNGTENWNKAQTQQSCHEGQTEGPTFRRMGKRRREGPRIERSRASPCLESSRFRIVRLKGESLNDGMGSHRPPRPPSFTVNGSLLCPW